MNTFLESRVHMCNSFLGDNASDLWSMSDIWSSCVCVLETMLQTMLQTYGVVRLIMS